MRVLILLALIAGISADCAMDYPHFKQTYMNFYKHAHEWDMDHYKAELKKFHDEFVCFNEGYMTKLAYFDHLSEDLKNLYFNPTSMKKMKEVKADLFKCDAPKHDGEHFDFCNDDVDHTFLECMKKVVGTCPEAEKVMHLAEDTFKWSKDHKHCRGGHLFYSIAAFI